MPKFIHIMLLVLLLTGCRSDRAKELFQDAESLMVSAPDSALRLLEGIDPATLDSRALRARHALLRSQALDKNGIDLKSDSVIAPAAAYYARHGSKRDRAYMHYYLGRIYDNADRIAEAAQAMKAAEKYALPLGETYLLGLIYNCRGNLYYSQYSLDEALAMYEKADSCFRLEGKSVFSGYMIQAKAKTYAVMQNFQASQSEYEKALEIFESIDNHRQVCLISSSLAYQMIKENIPTDSIKFFLRKIYNRHTSGITPAYDYAIWADIYYRERKIDSARFFGNKALLTQGKTVDQQNGILAYVSKIEECIGNYQTALEHLKEAYFILDSVSFYEKKNLVQRIEERFETKELQHRNEILYMRNRSYIYIGALILTVILSSFILILRRRQETIRKQNEEYKQNQAYIEALNENFETLKERYQELKKNAGNHSEEETKVLNAIEQRLNAMKELLGTAYSVSCNPQVLYKAFQCYASSIKKDKNAFSDLKHVLNKRYNGFVDHYFELHPTLTNKEQHFICMLLYGFPADGIRFIFKHNNPDSYYSQKYKLRRKLQLPSCIGDKIEEKLIQMAEEYKVAKDKESGSVNG